MFIKPVYCTGEECTGDRHYKWEEYHTDGHYKWEECTGDSRNAGKTVFWVFLTMHYLKSPKCFLISISRKLQNTSRILHCRKQLMSEEKWGKLKVPRFSGKTGGIHTFSKYRWLFTYHNSPGKANELQNEIILKEKRCHKGLRQQP